MVNKSNATTTRCSTGGQGPTREFLNNDPIPGMQKRQVVLPLGGKDLAREVLELAPEEQTKLIEKFDLVRFDIALSRYFVHYFAKECPTLGLQNLGHIIALGDTCSRIERLPTSAVLCKGLKKRDDHAVASGGFTEIWKGDLRDAPVAIKAFRMFPAADLRGIKEVRTCSPSVNFDEQDLQILWKRVPTWRRLSHSNILPFRGVNMTLFDLALVYDWGQNGNICQYIGSHQRASRSSLVRVAPSPRSLSILTSYIFLARVT